MSDELQPGRRDDLALVRTDLANERTLLAYGRTALMVIATGFSLIKFFPESILLRGVGWILAVVGVTLGFFGAVRFRRLRVRLQDARDETSA